MQAHYTIQLIRNENNHHTRKTMPLCSHNWNVDIRTRKPLPKQTNKRKKQNPMNPFSYIESKFQKPPSTTCLSQFKQCNILGSLVNFIYIYIYIYKKKKKKKKSSKLLTFILFAFLIKYKRTYMTCESVFLGFLRFSQQPNIWQRTQK